MMKRWQGLVEEFKTYLPVSEKTPNITLNEGNTPLIHCKALSAELGIELYVKYEGANPTGSSKIEVCLLRWLRLKKKGKRL